MEQRQALGTRQLAQLQHVVDHRVSPAHLGWHVALDVLRVVDQEIAVRGEARQLVQRGDDTSGRGQLVIREVTHAASVIVHDAEALRTTRMVEQHSRHLGGTDLPHVACRLREVDGRGDVVETDREVDRVEQRYRLAEALLSLAGQRIDDDLRLLAPQRTEER